MYDVVPDDPVVVRHPDIVIIEGLNVLQPARTREDGRSGLALSDFFDFSRLRRRRHRRHPARGTSSGSCGCARPRSATRRRTSAATPRSRREEATAEAEQIWDTINGPNLEQNIKPTRSRATLVLRKDRDHSVRYVRLRKL